MKIHFHISNLDPGGAQKVMISLANAWHEDGHQVSLSANSINGFWRSSIASEIELVDLNARNWLTAVPPLLKALANVKPDVILSAITQANFTAAIAGKISGTPCVLSERHHTSTWMTRLSPSKRTVYKSLLPLLYAQASACIAQTDASRRSLSKVAKLPDRAVFAIPNPITALPAISEKVPHPWLDDTNIPVVVGIGRLVSQKDFTTLIQAIELLQKQRLVRLIILGDGPLLAPLANLTRSQGMEDVVTFVGQVSNVQDYLARASVYALSSKFEGFPNTLLEALSLGVTAVCVSCPTGPREILADGRYGKLVPVGNPEAMANAIGQSIDHPDDPEALRMRAAEFDIKVVSGRYLDVLDQVVCHQN